MTKVLTSLTEQHLFTGCNNRKWLSRRVIRETRRVVSVWIHCTNTSPPLQPSCTVVLTVHRNSTISSHCTNSSPRLYHFIPFHKQFTTNAQSCTIVLKSNCTISHHCINTPLQLCYNCTILHLYTKTSLHHFAPLYQHFTTTAPSHSTAPRIHSKHTNLHHCCKNSLQLHHLSPLHQ